MARMVAFKIYFWTNEMGPDGGFIPGKAWEDGIVYLVKNNDHGLPADKEIFHRFEDIPEVIKQMARRNDLKLYRGKYSGGKEGQRFV